MAGETGHVRCTVLQAAAHVRGPEAFDTNTGETAAPPAALSVRFAGGHVAPAPIVIRLSDSFVFSDGPSRRTRLLRIVPTPPADVFPAPSLVMCCFRKSR
ncbi:hypothetical protein [Mycolicibacterium hodleri]|uniref:Uncharacterized protein n=1 Tax=Mycolicibacterium hodleri TaxID=49897 RepID=A0A502DZI0_9MYCO|nr:hypothetical protein [Mycolicibacterium hodleri]TPG29560.1 hypothetical protein EAH80_26410 [Mycolicibacterium hodleri]